MNAAQNAINPRTLMDSVITVVDHPVEVMLFGMGPGDSFIFEKSFGNDGQCWVPYNPCPAECTCIDLAHNPVLLRIPGRYRLVPMKGMILDGIMMVAAEITRAPMDCR